MAQTDLHAIWPDVLSEIAGPEVTPHQRAILALTCPVGIVGHTVVVAVPNDFTKDAVETRHRGPLAESLTRRMGQRIQLALTVDPALAPGPDEATTDVVADATYAPASERPVAVLQPVTAFGVSGFSFGRTEVIQVYSSRASASKRDGPENSGGRYWLI